MKVLRTAVSAEKFVRFDRSAVRPRLSPALPCPRVVRPRPATSSSSFAVLATATVTRGFATSSRTPSSSSTASSRTADKPLAGDYFHLPDGSGTMGSDKRARSESSNTSSVECFPPSPYLRSKRILTSWEMPSGGEVRGHSSSTTTNPFTRGHDAVFVGHVNTDLDSVAGAIGAAALFNGTPAISEENLNGEITFALSACGIQTPQLFSRIEGIEQKNICLVDHTEPKQMVPLIREKLLDNVVGVIDHHALARSFATDSPIWMDLRPWGSMSTIITHLFLQLQKPIPEAIARLLMSAILSDTLNLRSPTTVPEDRFAVTLLALRCGLQTSQEVDAYALQMFAAKTAWIASLGARKMCRADCKEFTSASGATKFGIAVLEIAGEPELLLSKVSDDELKTELSALKKEKDLRALFLCIVDVLAQKSVTLVLGEDEEQIARHAFPECKKVSDLVLDVGAFVSRKKEFMPRYTKAVSAVLEAGDDTSPRSSGDEK